MKKKYLTLVEMMVVVVIIGIVASIVGYNVHGALEKSKVMTTQYQIQKLQDILALELDQNPVENPELNWKELLQKSDLIKKEDRRKMIQDSWGEEFIVKYDHGEFLIKSKKLQRYEKQKKQL